MIHRFHISISVYYVYRVDLYTYSLTDSNIRNSKKWANFIIVTNLIVTANRNKPTESSDAASGYRRYAIRFYIYYSVIVLNQIKRCIAVYKYVYEICTKAHYNQIGSRR